jgi:hypothetical protein
MTELVLQWRSPAGPLAPTTTTVVGPPGPRVGERVQTVESSGVIAPLIDIFDLLDITALSVAATIANPIGTPGGGAPRLLVRIRDNGSSRGLTWDSGYASSGEGLELPAATVAGKLMHLGFIYYAATAKWMLVASTVEA